jgi:hypothetical protein
LNLKIDVQRMGLNLCESGFGTAYWARIYWPEYERHVLRPTLVQHSLTTLDHVER